MLQLTNYIEVSKPCLCLGSVDLAHVRALVSPLDVGDVKVPRSVPFVRDADSRIAGDHVVLDRQDGRAVVMDPGNLQKSMDYLA